MQILVVLSLFFAPSVALANAGLPMLAVVWPFSVFAFYPIIAIESVVVSHVLKLPMRKVLFGVILANAFSTLIGIPLTWVALVILEFLIVFSINILGIPFSSQALGKVGFTILTAPYLMPVPDYVQPVIPVATIVLLIPFFFASYKTESWLVIKIFSPEDPEKAKKAIWYANLVSYLGLFLCCAGWLLFSMFTQK